MKEAVVEVGGEIMLPISNIYLHSYNAHRGEARTASLKTASQNERVLPAKQVQALLMSYVFDSVDHTFPSKSVGVFLVAEQHLPQLNRI